MKKLLILIPFLALFILSGYTPSYQHEGSGIKFFEGTWADAVRKAKKENKYIFLDISASWCGPCKYLKRTTFPNEEVGAFYNKNFVCVEVDGEVGEGIMLAQRFRIPGYPSLIYLDKNEKLLQQTAGYRPPADFIMLGKKAIGK